MDRLRVTSYSPLRFDHLHGDRWVEMEPMETIHGPEGGHRDPKMLRCPACPDYAVTIDYSVSGRTPPDSALP